jgi:hypothetical protein
MADGKHLIAPSASNRSSGHVHDDVVFAGPCGCARASLSVSRFGFTVMSMMFPFSAFQRMPLVMMSVVRAGDSNACFH